MIVGATNENDLQIIKVADHFYKNFSLKECIIPVMFLFWKIKDYLL
jgi:predicted DNA-binding helix-hairpin-helix protein